jgi:hypothetical protein
MSLDYQFKKSHQLMPHASKALSWRTRRGAIGS